MFSFLILVVLYMASCFYSLIQDIKKNNEKHLFKWVVKIILLVVAVYLKSINL